MKRFKGLMVAMLAGTLMLAAPAFAAGRGGGGHAGGGFSRGGGVSRGGFAGGGGAQHFGGGSFSAPARGFSGGARGSTTPVTFEEADGVLASASTPGTLTRTATATGMRIPTLTIPTTQRRLTMVHRPLPWPAIPTAATTTPTAIGFPIRTAKLRRRRLRPRTDLLLRTETSA